MIRSLHRWPGLLAAVLLVVVTLSGAALSVFPAAERLSAPQAEAGLSVAVLAARIQSVYPGVEQIKQSPSGKITAYWFVDGTPGSAVIDPATGEGVGSADPNPVERWLTNLHRSLFLGDGGRIAMAVGAAAMLVLAVSGALLVARRAGGWRRWFAPLRGPLSGRLHVEIARVAVVGLALSAMTALWMSAVTFELLPVTESMPAFPADVSGETGVAVGTIEPLLQTPVEDLRALNFPYPGDATDVFTLKTDQGTGYLDQGTGAVLDWADLAGSERLFETIYMLHTGQGAALLGLVLGFMALGVPVLGVTGTLVWLAGRRGRPRIPGNQAAARADTILLVGSEGGSTWGFAATLHKALSARGHSVHVAPMTGFDPARFAKAQQFVVLAATYGDGDAPSSATGFLERIAALKSAPDAPLAVLGFGDRSYPDYCGFAQQVETAAKAKGWRMLLPFDTIDRQSPQDFARWGRLLGQVLGFDLELTHEPVLPKVETLTLVSRRDYGAEMQAPTAILRFALPKVTVWQRLTGQGFARFAAGDLLGIVPKGSAIPRLYSLASDRRDGFVEIVVKRQPSGLCSAQLTQLAPGDTATGFVRPNPGFKPGKGRAPLILIGAGTGIGPLAGFIRSNKRQRAIHLFFGMRHPQNDFLYGEDLAAWQQDGQLTKLDTAISRGNKPNYVQDALRAEHAEITRLIRNGARVMVCGGRGMASGVAEAFTDILAPMGLTTLKLKTEGRYVEDVY
ncbi:MAG: PepSY domain-containing protein [Yoonia sp.]|uniref:PepSY domain-containing protein n=1 Tax=Yoonia sp. TaxID=2212373 RepID=UPI00273E79EF|nr:PepSY domain-containing protein [Yoonia sp.]MDP5085549.1 PepSY domain-containing protein [Yoonia sp.]